MSSWGDPKSKLSYSLCNTCARAVPQECSWIDKAIRDGLRYENKFINTWGDKKMEVVSVVDCPNYIPGPPPGLGKRLTLKSEEKKMPNLQLIKPNVASPLLVDRPSTSDVLDITKDAKITIHDIVGCFIAVLGVRGSGKSNTAATIAEELLENKYPLVIMDIDGEYLELKDKYDIIVAGKGGDVDLELDPEQAGHLAEISVQKRLAVLLNLTGYNQDDQVILIQNYLETLWLVAGDEKVPYHILVEEAHEWVPEKKKHDLKDIITRIALRGRKRGLGAILVSQRSAKVSKDVLSQAEMFFFHKVTHPADLGLYQNLLSWPLKKVNAEIKNLETGESIFSFAGESQKIKCRKRHTQHGGCTPKFSRINSTNFEESVMELKKMLAENETNESEGLYMGGSSVAVQNSEQFNKSNELSLVECIKRGIGLEKAKVLTPQDFTKEDFLYLRRKGVFMKDVSRYYGFKSNGALYYRLEQMGLYQKPADRNKTAQTKKTNENFVNEKKHPVVENEPCILNVHSQVEAGVLDEEHEIICKRSTVRRAITTLDIAKVIFPDGVPADRMDDYNLVMLMLGKISELAETADPDYRTHIWNEISVLTRLGCVEN